MTEDETRYSDYVERARQEAQCYLLELLEDNQNLRGKVDLLLSEQSGLREQKLGLEKQMLSLRDDLDRLHAQQRGLRRRLGELEEENQSFSCGYQELQEQYSRLATLYVASYRLQETVERREVLRALEEIIINLIGGEEFAIFELKPGERTLSLALSSGLESYRVENPDFSAGPIDLSAESGEVYLAVDEGRQERESGRDDLIACVPLKLRDRVYGVIALLRLLSHKQGLVPLDHELFDLLSSHAATALYLSELHGRLGDGTEVES